MMIKSFKKLVTRRRLIGFFVFVPWILILVQVVILLFYAVLGCDDYLQPCKLIGGEYVDALQNISFTIGYQIVLSMFWVVPLALVWIVVEVALLISRKMRT